MPPFFSEAKVLFMHGGFPGGVLLLNTYESAKVTGNHGSVYMPKVSVKPCDSRLCAGGLAGSILAGRRTFRNCESA